MEKVCGRGILLFLSRGAFKRMRKRFSWGREIFTDELSFFSDGCFAKLSFPFAETNASTARGSVLLCSMLAGFSIYIQNTLAALIIQIHLIW
uniref:Uncharacterized protein n=1 Tax=Pyxicephalus adspersus TaxID=30357 RepID=A0AAV3A2V3_PYXAD|nr:TPA: hypothetical protein GDO54_018360 [Pyxicephalus adspersus]